MLQTNIGWKQANSSEEMSFENVNRRRTDGRTDRRTPDAGRAPDARTPDGRWMTDGERTQKLILSICSGELTKRESIYNKGGHYITARESTFL